MREEEAVDSGESLACSFALFLPSSPPLPNIVGLAGIFRLRWTRSGQTCGNEEVQKDSYTS